MAHEHPVLVDRDVLVRNDIGPVSYTHLDVYKRQAYHLRKCLEDAIEYRHDKEEAEKSGSWFKRDLGMENMLKVLNKEMPIHVHAHRSCLLYTSPPWVFMRRSTAYSRSLSEFSWPWAMTPSWAAPSSSWASPSAMPPEPPTPIDVYKRQ